MGNFSPLCKRQNAQQMLSENPQIKDQYIFENEKYRQRNRNPQSNHEFQQKGKTLKQQMIDPNDSNFKFTQNQTTFRQPSPCRIDSNNPKFCQKGMASKQQRSDPKMKLNQKQSPLRQQQQQQLQPECIDSRTDYFLKQTITKQNTYMTNQTFNHRNNQPYSQVQKGFPPQQELKPNYQNNFNHRNNQPYPQVQNGFPPKQELKPNQQNNFYNKNQYSQVPKQKEALDLQQAEAQERLESLTQKYNQIKKEIKSIKDPRKIKENLDKLFMNFVDKLQSFNVYNPYPKQGNLKYVAIIGETSSGKSTIYNKMFGVNLETGQGEVTMKIEMIYQDKTRNREYFDAPGLNEEIEIIDAQVLHSFYQIDCVFIVTDRTFKECKRAIQVMNKINHPQMTFVRTKCDLFNSEAELQKVKNQDRDNLKSFGINHPEILYVSSHKPDSFKDNLRFKKLMKGE